MFKRKGGGGQRPFEQCSKKLHFSLMTASLMMVTKNANGKNEHYVFKLVDTVAGGAGVPVTAVGLLASGNWYPGGTKILKY